VTAGPKAVSDARTLAFERTKAATDAFHRLCLTIVKQGPALRRYGPGYPCLAEDEAQIATLLTRSTDPDDDNLLLMDCQMVTALAALCFSPGPAKPPSHCAA